MNHKHTRGVGVLIFLAFSIVFYLSLASQIYATTNTNTEVPDQMVNIAKLIQEKTPGFISKPIIFVADSLEQTRVNVGIYSESKKEAAKAEIKVINTDKSSVKARVGANQLEKPIKYLQLFFFAFISFIFNNIYLFYSIFALLVFLIVRTIWRLIF